MEKIEIKITKEIEKKVLDRWISKTFEKLKKVREEKNNYEIQKTVLHYFDIIKFAKEEQIFNKEELNNYEKKYFEITEGR